jgi:hypothetical protein
MDLLNYLQEEGSYQNLEDFQKEKIDEFKNKLLESRQEGLSNLVLPAIELYKKGKEIDKKLGVDFLYDKKKKGGVTNDYMEMDIPQDQVQWYIDNGYDVEILD